MNSNEELRILIAQEPEDFAAFRKTLGSFDLVEVTTVKQAERMLAEDGIDLIIIDQFFDHNQSKQVIETARESRTHAQTPIVVTRKVDSPDFQNNVGPERLIDLSLDDEYTGLRMIVREPNNDS